MLQEDQKGNDMSLVLSDKFVKTKPSKEDIKQEIRDQQSEKELKLNSLKTCKDSGTTIKECIALEKDKDKEFDYSKVFNKTDSENNNYLVKVKVTDYT